MFNKINKQIEIHILDAPDLGRCQNVKADRRSQICTPLIN